MKVVLKGCPRCHGDLVPDRWSEDGRDMCCVQCGYEAPLRLVSRTAPTLVATNSAPVLAAVPALTSNVQRRVA